MNCIVTRSLYIIYPGRTLLISEAQGFNKGRKKGKGKYIDCELFILKRSSVPASVNTVCQKDGNRKDKGDPI